MRVGAPLVPEVGLAHAFVPAKLGAFALDCYLPHLQHVRTGCGIEGDVRVLLDDQHGQPIVGIELLDDAEDLLDDRGREPERWLVEHQQPRPADEGTGEREHLLLAAAERARLLIATTLQPGEVPEDPWSLVAHSAPLSANVGPHPEVLPNAELAEETTALWHVRDPGTRDLVRLPARDLLALEDDLAAVAHGSRDCA